MCNHLNLKILIHIFTVIFLITIIVIMRGENCVVHLHGLGGTPVCLGTPIAHHCLRVIARWPFTLRDQGLHLIKASIYLHDDNYPSSGPLTCYKYTRLGACLLPSPSSTWSKASGDTSECYTQLDLSWVSLIQSNPLFPFYLHYSYIILPSTPRSSRCSN
jgi:hypothetical protein